MEELSPHFVPIRIGWDLDVASMSAASCTVENSTKACCFLERKSTCFTRPNGQETVRMSISEHSSGRFRKCKTLEGGHSAAAVVSVVVRAGIMISCLFENCAAIVLSQETSYSTKSISNINGLKYVFVNIIF